MKIQWVPAFDLLMVENESGRVLLDGDDLAQLQTWLQFDTELDEWLNEEASHE
jgi:hypothetical protein